MEGSLNAPSHFFMRVVVAIDGPAGAGKSTLARRLARKLSFLYIDSGAMYRTVALWASRLGVAADDMQRLEQLALMAEIRLGEGRVALNGEDVSDAIRMPIISALASKVAAVPAVRRALVAKQREYAEENCVVMEGRDIGSVVFPYAAVKIYLDASPEERARRRALELRQRGEAADEASIASEMRERDRRDSTRPDSPLIQAPDAEYLCSDGMTLDEVEAALLKIVRERTSNGKVLS